MVSKSALGADTASQAKSALSKFEVETLTQEPEHMRGSARAEKATQITRIKADPDMGHRVLEQFLSGSVAFEKSSCCLSIGQT